VPPSATPLTKKQRAFLAALLAFYHREGRTPTLRELGVECGITSTGQVHHYLTHLGKKGYLRRDYNATRGIRLLAPALTGAHPSVGWAT
jgi:repressor LexA